MKEPFCIKVGKRAIDLFMNKALSTKWWYKYVYVDLTGIILLATVNYILRLWSSNKEMVCKSMTKCFAFCDNFKNISLFSIVLCI